MKTNKYAYLLHDITRYDPSVTAFEIGSRGYITSDNKKRLQALYKYCDRNITFKKFIENISAISITSSYYIFNTRKEPTWAAISSIGPLF